MPKKATEFIQLKLRIREGLRRQIEREAKKSGRSVNAETVERLERSFEQQQTADIIKDIARATAQESFLLIESKIPKAFLDWAAEKEKEGEK